MIAHLDDRLPVWPNDIFATLYGKLNCPELKIPDRNLWEDLLPPDKPPSFVFNLVDPAAQFSKLVSLYHHIVSINPDTRRRAEYGLRLMVRDGYEPTLECLPPGLAAPLREVLRTCQLSPSGSWPIPAYQLVGRNDLAEGLSKSSYPLHTSGYRSVKDYIVSNSVLNFLWLSVSSQGRLTAQLPTFPRKSISEHTDEVRRAISGEVASVTGVELELEDFTSIRFGQDRRLEEVSRLLCSSTVSAIKTIERTELT